VIDIPDFGGRLDGYPLAPARSWVTLPVTNDRTAEGRSRAQKRGQHMGRPPKLTPHQKHEAIKRRDTGDETLAELACSYEVGKSTISRL